MKKLIIMVLMIVLIALFTGVASAKVQECKPSDVLLVMDRSGSMGTTDPGESDTRMNLAKGAAKYFVDLLTTDDQSGLASFSYSATLDQTLTGDKTLVKTAIDSLVSGDLTCISCGLSFALSDLTTNARPGVTHAIVLLSDGHPTADTNALALAAADAVKSAGVIIYTIGIGEADQDLLEDIASDPSKFSFGAPGDLDSIYEGIAGALCEGPNPYCGDGVLDNTEQCDDGNTDNGDGCSATCMIEETNDVPEFGIIAALGILTIAGLYIYRKRH